MSSYNPSSNQVHEPLLLENSSGISQEAPDIEVQQPPLETHFTLAMTEAISIAKLALPLVLTSLLMYSRAMVSMLFLGKIGDQALAGGSLAIGFANITGYSILSGLSMGMEPICGQAFGARRYRVLGLVLQKTILLLLLASLPISILWLNMQKIMLLCHQDETIANVAHTYILFSLPDLISLSLLHPIRIYLRSQSITLPQTYCAAVPIILHIPINYLLVIYLNLGVKGVALSGVLTNFNLVISLITYIVHSGIYTNTWCPISKDCLKDLKPLASLAIPSCISVCLEWWWYEIMVLLCGWLANPQATIASMGILIQTTSLIYIFPSSLGLSVSTRVGNELGANHPRVAKLCTIVGLCFSFVLGICAVIFTIRMKKLWATFFTKDLEIIALTSSVLPIIGLCELGNCPQTTGCGALRGLARPKIAAQINAGSFYLVGCTAALLLGFRWGYGFKGLWLGLLVAQLTCVVAMMIALKKTHWKAQAQDVEQLPLDVRDQEEEEDNPNLVK